MALATQTEPEALFVISGYTNVVVLQLTPPIYRKSLQLVGLSTVRLSSVKDCSRIESGTFLVLRYFVV